MTFIVYIDYSVLKMEMEQKIYLEMSGIICLIKINLSAYFPISLILNKSIKRKKFIFYIQLLPSNWRGVFLG